MSKERHQKFEYSLGLFLLQMQASNMMNSQKDSNHAGKLNNHPFILETHQAICISDISPSAHYDGVSLLHCTRKCRGYVRGMGLGFVWALGGRKSIPKCRSSTSLFDNMSVCSVGDEREDLIKKRKCFIQCLGLVRYCRLTKSIRFLRRTLEG